MRRDRRGVTLVELLVALACGVVLLHLALGALGATRAGASRLVERSERLGAFRAARVILRRELGAGVGGRDWRVGAPDSVVLRAFRGRAVPCGPSGVDELTVGWAGLRAPVPAKDSVLLLDDEGGWWPADLVASGADGVCAGAGASARWRLSVLPPRPVVLVRLFESVSYHLSDGALRIRHGGSGRQPLTPPVLSSRSRIERIGPSVEVRLEATGSTGRRWRGVVARQR